MQKQNRLSILVILFDAITPIPGCSGRGGSSDESNVTDTIMSEISLLQVAKITDGDDQFALRLRAAPALRPNRKTCIQISLTLIKLSIWSDLS